MPQPAYPAIGGVGRQQLANDIPIEDVADPDAEGVCCGLPLERRRFLLFVCFDFFLSVLVWIISVVGFFVFNFFAVKNLSLVQCQHV